MLSHSIEIPCRNPHTALLSSHRASILASHGAGWLLSCLSLRCPLVISCSVLLSLMVSSQDCKMGMGWMCVISRRRWFGWRLAATVVVEGMRRQWGRSMGEGRALTMGSYFSEIGLTVDENEGIKVRGWGGGGGDLLVSAIEYKATFSSPVPGST